MKRIGLAVALAMGAMAQGCLAITARESANEYVRTVHTVLRDISAPNGGRRRPGRFAAAHKRAAAKRRNLRLHPAH